MIIQTQCMPRRRRAIVRTALQLSISSIGTLISLGHLSPPFQPRFICRLARWRCLLRRLPVSSVTRHRLRSRCYLACAPSHPCSTSRSMASPWLTARVATFGAATPCASCWAWRAICSTSSAVRPHYPTVYAMRTLMWERFAQVTCVHARASSWRCALSPSPSHTTFANAAPVRARDGHAREMTLCALPPSDARVPAGSRARHLCNPRATRLHRPAGDATHASREQRDERQRFGAQRRFPRVLHRCIGASVLHRGLVVRLH
jgi:hypothetical protein